MLPILATPKYDMIVPSTGKPITYRPYVVKEEKILLIAMESNDEKAINNAVLDTIKACVESPINIDDLTRFDVEYMFVTLRSKSVGEGIKLTPKCSECDEEHNVKVDLEQVKIANLDDTVDKHIKITDDISVDIKWATMKDKDDDFAGDTETQTIINLMVNSLETIYSGEDIFAVQDVPKNEVIDFVESLNPDQFDSIVQVLSKAPYLSYDIVFDCVKCTKKNTITLNGLIDFFQ